VKKNYLCSHDPLTFSNEVALAAGAVPEPGVNVMELVSFAIDVIAEE
jgi:hypothetical protein